MSQNVSTLIASGDPSDGFRGAAALRRLAEQVEARSVEVARAHGWSWDQIGDALGVSRQSAHARFGRRRTR